MHRLFSNSYSTLSSVSRAISSISILASHRFCPAFQRRNMSDKPGPDDIAVKKLGVSDPKSVSEEDWKKVLPEKVYEVAREAGTEAPYSGAYDKFFEKGRYVCLCCGAELFNSDSKFWSGCGWPAFSKSVDNDLNVVRIKDVSYGMERTEVRCKQCNAHLGHVFDDGPKETGERYCINSVCMAFEPADAEPASKQ